MATHSSTFARKIPWTEEPVGYSPWGRKEWDTTERPHSLKWPGSRLILAVVVQLLSHVQHFGTPWTAAHQASLSFTISCNLPNSCPLCQWCYLTISSSATLFSFCLPSFLFNQSLFQCIVVVQSPSHVQLFTTPRTAARQHSLPFSISRNLFRLMCIESVMPSNLLILCHPPLLLPSVFPSIRVFSNELALLSDFTKSYFANDLIKKNSQKENIVNSWRLWSGS